MKDVTSAYLAKEQADQRKPVDLFHIWQTDGSQHWYYTSGDVDISFDSQTWEGASLVAGEVRYDSTLDINSMTITVPALDPAVADYLAVNPVDPLWISQKRLHREQSPLEASLVFIGQIKKVSFKGLAGSVECVGFEHFLQKPVPLWRYQINCNHKLFDDRCALTKSSYKTTEAVTIDASLCVLTGTAFGTEDDGYFTGGEVVYGSESRAIVAHSGTSITLAYKFLELTGPGVVDVYPGCDGRPETCRDKFNNIENRLGFENSPTENPGERIAW